MKRSDDLVERLVDVSHLDGARHDRDRRRTLPLLPAPMMRSMILRAELADKLAVTQGHDDLLRSRGRWRTFRHLTRQGRFPLTRAKIR